MSTHNIRFYEEISKISLNYHQTRTLSLLSHTLYISIGNMVCLDREGNKAARDNFMSLMANCEHRQTLVQDLITKNNQLK